MHSLQRENSGTIAGVRPLAFDWAVECRHPMTVLARDYWRACRGERTMPSRTDLNPSAMRKFIAPVGLIAVRPSDADAGNYFIRTAGRKWEDVFGPMTGKTLDQFLEPAIEARWRAVFDPVCAKAAPVRVTTGIAFQKKGWLSSEMFIAPLSDDGTSVSMLLMCFTAWSEAHDKPF